MVRINTSSGFSGITLDNNLYHFPGGTLFRVGSNEYATLSLFKSAHSGQEQNGLEGDPLFEDAPSDFHLTSASVNAIDMGADLSGFVDSDRDGAARPVDGDSAGGAAWDIGPYEYNAGAGTVRITRKSTDLFGFYIYPNPIGKGAEIKVLLQNAPFGSAQGDKWQNTKLKIFDIEGRLVYSQSPNRNSRLIWQASNVASGLYIIHLNVDDRTIAAQKVIVK